MTLIKTNSTNLINGVSQQPGVIRLPSQAEVQDNCYPSATEGLSRRQPSEHVGQLTTNTVDPFIHWINRDSAERYNVVIQETTAGAAELRVFDLTGLEAPVYAPGGGAVDFTYLGISPSAVGPWLSRYFKALTVADYTFILNTKKRVVHTGPSGYQPDEYDDVPGHGYVQVVQGNYLSRYKITVGTNAGSVEDEVFTLETWDGNKDNTENDSQQSIYQVWFQAYYSSGLWYIGTPTQDWELAYTTNASGGTGSTTIPSPAGQNTAYTVLKLLVDQFIQAIAGLGFVRSMNVKFTGDKAWFEIASSNDPTFDVAPTMPTVPGGGPNWSITQIQPNAVGKAKYIGTSEIAARLAKKINEESSVYTAEVHGSTIRILSPYPLDRLDVEDSFGDGGMRSVAREAQSFEDLPLVAREGYGVKVIGNAANLEDDYWVRFKTNEDTTEPEQTGAKGVWIEGAPLFSLGSFLALPRGYDPTLLPHTLVRMQDDVFGTITGTPDKIYFEFGPATWDLREVGDAQANPGPSLTNKFIEDLFFHKNRLGFISGSNVLMSEAGRYFNFFRTTVRNLLDSDPIDVTASHVKAVTLKHAVPSQDNLVLFSDRAQLVLSAEPLLTPRTVSINPVSDFEVSLRVRPVNLARSILFARKRGGYSSLVEFYRADEVSFDGRDLTAHIPAYILGDVTSIAFAEAERAAAVVTEGGEALYVYNFFIQGQQQLQNAWHRYTFGTGEVVSCAFYESDLYVVVRRADGLFLERLSFSVSAQDTESTFQVRLDRRIDDTSLQSFTYDSGTDRTELVLPYDLEAGAPMAVATRADATHTGGANIPIVFTDTTTPGDHKLYIEGDWTTFPLWIGETYESVFEFSPITVKRAGPAGQELVLGGSIQLLTGKLVYENSGYFKVEVTPHLRAAIAQEYNGPPIAEQMVSTLDPFLGRGVFTFSVMGKNDDTRIVVRSSSPLPFSLLTAEWSLNYHSRSGQR